MPITVFELSTLLQMPWKNGGGTTREIVRRPADAELGAIDWRVSVAHLQADGPFSTYPDIDRVIMLLDGAGVHLRSAAGEVDHRLDVALEPFSFRGEEEIAGSLISGASSDFNVMTRRATTRADVQVLRTGQTLPASSGGLLFAARGAWQVRGTGADASPAPDVEHTLAADAGVWWEGDPTAWRVTPLESGAALVAVRIVRL